MIISIVSPHLIYLALSPLISYFKKKKAEKAFIQKEMNDAIIGPNFDFTAKYALCLNTIFVTLFFSSGMPILLVFGGLSLFLQYWAEKYLCKFIFFIYFNLSSIKK